MIDNETAELGKCVDGFVESAKSDAATPIGVREIGSDASSHVIRLNLLVKVR